MKRTMAQVAGWMSVTLLALLLVSQLMPTTAWGGEESADPTTLAYTCGNCSCGIYQGETEKTCSSARFPAWCRTTCGCFWLLNETKWVCTDKPAQPPTG